MKTIFSKKAKQYDLNEEELALKLANGKLQGFLGSLRKEVVGGGVLNEQTYLIHPEEHDDAKKAKQESKNLLLEMQDPNNDPYLQTTTTESPSLDDTMGEALKQVITGQSYRM